MLKSYSDSAHFLRFILAFIAIVAYAPFKAHLLTFVNIVRRNILKAPVKLFETVYIITLGMQLLSAERCKRLRLIHIVIQIFACIEGEHTGITLFEHLLILYIHTAEFKRYSRTVTVIFQF